MFNCDKPLENANQDKLNRRDFASHLAKAIFEYNTCQDGLVIGLCGPCEYSGAAKPPVRS